MTYAIKKQFTKGILAGSFYKEITGIKFQEGKDYGNYIVVSCKELKNSDTVQIEATRPYQAGNGTAFASGMLEYIRRVKQSWLNSGYMNIHIWAD